MSQKRKPGRPPAFKPKPGETPEQAARALVTPLRPPDPSLRKIRNPRKR